MDSKGTTVLEKNKHLFAYQNSSIPKKEIRMDSCETETLYILMGKKQRRKRMDSQIPRDPCDILSVHVLRSLLTHGSLSGRSHGLWN